MHRSRSREKPRAGFDLMTNAEGKPVDAEGHIQTRNYIKASMIELDSNFSCDPPTVANSITFDFKSSSSKKKTKAPIRAPLDKEMSIEKQTRRSSPTVIARLMGLDTLPSPQSLKPQKEVKNCSHKLSYKDLHEKLTRHDCLLKESNDVHKEFKDVFEVAQVPKVENHKNQDIRKRRSDVKQSEMGMAFIRQSFINAKRLSTDEKLQRSKEFDNALEVLESNKDLFLKLLQEPHSLFSKHFQDLSYSPHTTCESSLRSEIRDKRSINLQISDSLPLKKPAVKSSGHHFKEPMCSLPETLSDSMYAEKVEDHAQPAQIVILKPSLAKARKVERTEKAVKSRDKRQHDITDHIELLKEDIKELYQEEPSKFAQREMRNASATGRMFSASKYSNFVQDDGLWPVSSSLTSYRTSDNVYDLGKSFSPSSSSAIESSVNFGASKRLSEQRRLSRHELDLSMRVSGTLGEMLALSDNETFNRAHDRTIVKKACPSSISSKDGFARNLPRSKSLPASCIVSGSWHHNPRNRFVCSKSRFMPENVDEDLVKPKNFSLKSLPDHQSKRNSDGKGKRFPARKIHVSSEEFKHRSYVVPLPEEEHIACNLSDIHRTGEVEIFSVPSSNIAVSSLLMKDKTLEKLHKGAIMSERNGEHSERGFSDMLSKQASADLGIDELLPSCCTRSVSVSPDSYKEADQPSPVSVLELSSNGDKSSSGCFKKISTDLQELRTQLRFLKLDSPDGLEEEIEAFISGDEDSGEPLPQLADMLEAFRDEEDRDYSFLVDMLIDSGIMKSEKIELFGACESTELPVPADVFNKLEQKYKSVESWSRSERMLLFDLINSALADISAMFFMNMCSLMKKPGLWWQAKMAHEGLVEEIWQAVVRCRKELSVSFTEENQRWFNGGHDSQSVGNLLSEHLMDQLLTELIYVWI